MSIEEKFRAAVNVIRSLPKNGSYQPSNDLMLRFYGYFKQASEGPCTQPRPSFWEVVKKMKWDAWNKLGNMPREEAMANYIAELTKIVETMSYTDNVASFMASGSLDSFYEQMPMDDLELVLGTVIEKVRSRPGSPLSASPFGSREASPHRVGTMNGNGRTHTSSLEVSPTSSFSPSPQPPDQDEDEDEDEFIDTVETAPERINVKESSGKPSKRTYRGLANGLPNGDIKINGHMVNGHDDGEAEGKDRGRPRERNSPLMARARMNQATGGDQRGRGGQTSVDISQQIQETVLHLQRDLDRITSRVRSLEVSALANSPAWSTIQTKSTRPVWWPFSEISPRTAAFFVVWPIVAHFLMSYLQRRRNNRLS